MQSCIRSLTSRRSHLGLSFGNSGSLSLSRRLTRMQAVQSRAVQTEAAPAEKQGLKSLEVCFQLFHTCLCSLQSLCHAEAQPEAAKQHRQHAYFTSTCLTCLSALYTSPSAHLRTSDPPTYNDCPDGCACARRICTLRAASPQNCLEILTQRTGGDR